MHKTISISLATVFLLTLSACDTLRVGTSRNAANDATLPLARALDRQILELDQLGSGTYQQRIDVYRLIELEFVDNPNDSNRLRLALAKSIEGHPATDMESALRELNALLKEANTLSPTQLRLAGITARDVEARLIAHAELDTLRQRANQQEQSSTLQNNRVDRRLQSTRNSLREAQAENERLQEELAQARRQLDAIMSIETSSDPVN